MLSFPQDKSFAASFMDSNGLEIDVETFWLNLDDIIINTNIELNEIIIDIISSLLRLLIIISL